MYIGLLVKFIMAEAVDHGRFADALVSEEDDLVGALGEGGACDGAHAQLSNYNHRIMLKLIIFFYFCKHSLICF